MNPLNIASMLRSYKGPGKSGFWALFDKHLIGKGVLTIKFPRNYNLLCDTREHWQRVMIGGCYDRVEFSLIRKLLKPGDIFIDGGAYNGYYTFAMASEVGKNGKVFAFEPNPQWNHLLNESKNLNPNLNIEVFESALTSHKGQETFYLPPPNGWQSVEGSLKVVEGWKTATVSTMSLDDFIREKNLQKVDLCKLDLERGEPEALRGAFESLRSGVLESLFCEILDETREEIFKILSKFPFEKIICIETLQPVTLETLRSGLSNVLWLRGSCLKQWEKISRFQKALLALHWEL